MGTALAVPQGLGADIERVVIGGDLTPLNPEQRIRYYNAICSSMGLNPLTGPFSYIVLNGKLQLYAKKDCTEQLRKIHGVSITRIDPKQIGDLLVVVADAKDREDRVDSSTGAVNVAGLKGEALANAMMKAETKSKRRVTLSICGLGMLDETEVDTLKQQGVASEPQGNNWQAPNPTSPHPTSQATATWTTETLVGTATTIHSGPHSDSTRNANAIPTSVISHSTDEPDIRPRSQKQVQTPPDLSGVFPRSSESQQSAPQGQVTGPEPPITEKQRKMLFAISRSANLSDQDVKDTLAGIGLTCHRDDIPKGRFQDVLDAIDPNYKFHTRKD